MNAHIIRLILDAEQKHAKASLLERARGLSDPFARRKLLAGIFPGDIAPAVSAWMQRLPVAAHKWPHLSLPFFSEKSLQQGTAWPVALFRAKEITHRVQEAGVMSDKWLDGTCAAGGDLTAWRHADAGLDGVDVVGVDVSEDCVACATANLERVVFPNRSVSARAYRADIEGAVARETPGVVFADPDRRPLTGGRRVAGSLDRAVPDSRTLVRLVKKGVALIVKAAPALNDLGALAAMFPERMAVSLNDEMKEQLLFSPPVRRHARSAVALPSGDRVSSDDPSADMTQMRPLTEGDTVIIPGAAVRQARLTAELCFRLNAAPLDGSRWCLIAGDTGLPRLTPPGSGRLYRAYSVVRILPQSRRGLKKALRDIHGSGAPVTVKRLDAGRRDKETDRILNALAARRAVRGIGGQPVILLITQLHDAPAVIQLNEA